MDSFEDSQINFPLGLRGKNREIFGNMRQIYQFHKNELFPKLRSVQSDSMEVANIFNTLIDQNYFYCYVSYASNKKQSDEVCLQYKDFLEVRISFVFR